ncbi:MAG: glycosyl hydrolase family 18 protein [Candidatus Sungbacteria bacterium]|nr:glycosyl hydrolase family 18 protein [bacterium]MDZ4286223.1 glycosyl hydrolase family 18 protein [Candidatus Sungbacteria bacterium]
MKRAILSISFLFFFVLFIMPAPARAAARSLWLGLSGSDVRGVQNQLIAAGYLGRAHNSGYFGSLTEAAVKKFQCDHNVICAGSSSSGYGIVGPKTRTALNSATAASDNPATLNPRTLTPAAVGAFEFSGWIPYWRSATGTQDVIPHLARLKSVMPFGYTVKNNGTLADTAHLTQEPWSSFIAKAKQHNVRIIPTVMWGNGASIHKILSNTKTRIALENEIANMVKKNGYDGIDIDFEAKQHQTITYFSTFLKGLYQRMGNKWVYCTIEARMPLENRYSPGAVIPPDATDYANDYVEMNKYCDRVEIMAYDQGTIDVRLNAIRQAPYAPVADPAWVENVVSLAAQSIARNKLVLGIPTYGYEYAVTPMPGNGYQYNVLWPFNPKYAIDIASQLGIAPARNNANEIGFMYDPKILAAIAPEESESTQTQQAIASTALVKNQNPPVNTSMPFNYLSWSDAQAIAEKVALARKLGLRGVAIFKFDGGQDPNMWNVLR